MQIKTVQPQRRVSAQAGLTGRSSKTLRKKSHYFKFNQGSSRLLPRRSPLPGVRSPADGDRKVQTFPGCCKRLFENNRTRTAAFRPAHVHPRSEKSAFAWRAAAPLRRCTILHNNKPGTTWKRDGKLRAPPTFNAAIPYLIRSCSSGCFQVYFV